MSPLLLVLLIGAGCTPFVDSPHLDTATPASARRATNVTLAGTGFCPDACTTTTGEVLIGLDLPQVAAHIIAYDRARAVIEIPDVTPIGDTSLILVVDGRSSNALDFRIDE